MFNEPDFPVQLLVGRELAKRQNVDDSTATRVALTSTLIAKGVLAPIIARQLAIREAPTTVLAPASSHGGGGTTTPTTPVGGVPAPATPAPASTAVEAHLNQISASIKQFVEAQVKQEQQDREKAKALLEAAEKQEKERREALGKLCDVLGAFGAHEDEPAPGTPPATGGTPQGAPANSIAPARQPPPQPEQPRKNEPRG